MGSDSKFSKYFYNPVTYAGVILSLFVFFIEICLFTIDFLAHRENLYLGLITFVVLPPFLILGLILIPLGALWKRSRVLRHLTPLEPKPFYVNLSKSSHRRTVLIFVIGTMILAVMSAIGAYKGFHYTESTAFCGTLCHKVMEPEHATYLRSPHAKVKCASCHIGTGASWYVKSKLTGARQVIHALKGSYPRPVQSPVKDLRPARETCLECHWPEKKFGAYDFKRDYHLTEGEYPSWHLRMLLPTGTDEKGNPGVHAHMNVDHDIYYAAEDEKRQKITWVKSVDKNGTATVFTSPGSLYRDKAPPADLIRRMDCIDCHNRPAHRFVAPTRLIDNALNAGLIDSSIPGVKEAVLESISEEYTSTDEAMQGIAESLKEFFEDANEESEEEQIDDTAVEAVIDTARQLYSSNTFPEMKVRWDTHPDNIGHMIFSGCFRCHGGEHRAPDDRVITRDCKVCHTIVEQGPPGRVVKDLNGLDFIHPSDDDVDLRKDSCIECHTGGF